MLPDEPIGWESMMRSTTKQPEKTLATFLKGYATVVRKDMAAVDARSFLAGG